MKTNVWLGGLAVALLGLGVVHGQQPAMNGTGTGTQAPFEATLGGCPPETPKPGPPPLPPGPSDWLVYPHAANCCNNIGRNGPITWEVYARVGVSMPIGSGIFGATMDGGLTLAMGGRSLFFNQGCDAAWTVDVGIVNVNYNSTTGERVRLNNVDVQTQTGLQTIPTINVTPTGLNQTFFNLAVGREHYLRGSGCQSGCQGEPMWRVGWDVGGRWGSSKLDMVELRHRTDVCGGLVLALHSDIEIPWGCCIFVAGVRGEYSLIFSDILQRQNDADLHTFNVLANLGVKF